MYSKTLAVFLIVCLTQGLTLDFDSAIKNIETQSKEEYLVDQITKQSLALLRDLADKTLQSKAKVCNPDINPLKIVAIQLLQCGKAFENYSNESKCDGKINEISKNFNKLANITSDFVHNIKSEENVKNVNNDIFKLIAAIFWDYEQYLWCEGLKPKPHTSDELEFCHEHLTEILHALKVEIDQCSNNPVITYHAKTGEDNEFEFYQLVSWFHLWLNASANDVHSCPSVNGDLAHLRNAWESLHKAILELSETQEDQSECKNATVELSSALYEIKLIIQNYMENHPINSDWLHDSILKAKELGLSKNKALEACPELKEIIVNVTVNGQKEIMDIQAKIHNKVDQCRQQSAAAQSANVQAAQVHAVKKRNVNCEELENYLTGKIYEFAEDIKHRIKSDIKNTDCKASLINNIDDAKAQVYITTQNKDYSDAAIKEFLEAIEDDLLQIPFPCLQISESDFNNFLKIAKEIYNEYKNIVPGLKNKLEELQKCPRPVK